MAVLRIRNEFELQDVIDELGEPPDWSCATLR